MNRAPAALLAGVLGACVVSISSWARAEVSLSTELRGRRVEAGARFSLQLRAIASAGERVGNPSLKLPPGITASGPSVGQQSQVSIVNGRMTQSVGITATWVLVASKPGTYKLGPASVQTDSGVLSDRAVTVEVVPAGTLPAPLGDQPSFDPFNMLRGLGGPGFPGFPGFDEPDASREPQLPLLPEEYRIERALDPLAFLRARAVPRKVVVGEQVTLGVYAYAGRGAFEPGTLTEPSRNDFLAFNLMEDAQHLQGYPFDLDGQRWIAVKISQFALFPLKPGKLKAGEMSLGFVGRGYSKDPGGLVRKSLPVDIHVVEPPIEGRPPGYKLGDVGTGYSLDAQVEPREVPAGGSISVVAKLKGVGNVPYSLLLPEQNGVRFLEPQLVEQVGPQRGVVQGFRTFTYVVELSEPGERDLGEITLPYWDPQAKAYKVARASLGSVKVTGTAKPPPTSVAPGAAASPRLKGLVRLPEKLTLTAPEKRSYWPAHRGYWLLLFGLPLGTLMGFALSDLARLLRKRFSEKRGSLATALDEALARLSAASKSGDAPASATAAERALFLAIEKRTGIKARGILKAQLAPALGEAKVPPPTARAAAELLDRCDELRFAGHAVDLQTFTEEVKKICKELGSP